MIPSILRIHTIISVAMSRLSKQVFCHPMIVRVIENAFIHCFDALSMNSIIPKYVNFS